MNTGSPRLYLLITILFAHMSCALVPSPIPTPTANDNICEKAAHHRASCVGNYLTPPICDDTAATIAQEMLAVPCEDFDEAYPEETTADGALCDWFGTGCTPDEVLFDGPACSTDDDCTGQSYCIENHCFDGVTSSQFATTLDHFTDTVEESGSSTALLADNVETRKRRRTLIEGATHSLHFTTLFIYDDEIGVEMVELFSAAARRGVEVRVLVDATSQYSFSNYDPLKELAKAGVDVISFNPITEWAGLRQETPGLTANNRLHEKILIADGKEAVIGGRNIGDAYFLPGRWRDADVYVDGPGVAGIQRKFLTFWDRNSAWELDAGCPNQSIHGFYCPATKTPLLEDPAYFPELKTSGQAYTRAIYSDPYAQETTLGYLTTLALIRSARESITIANAYVVPPRRLRKHLRAAVARGV
ncbi:MAG: phospholipase D-like domain-containing protein, partial [Bradymonadaceae bacterium]